MPHPAPAFSLSEVTASKPPRLHAPTQSCVEPRLRHRRPRPPNAAISDATPRHESRHLPRSLSRPPMPQPERFSGAMPPFPERLGACHTKLRPAVSGAHHTSQRSAHPTPAKALRQLLQHSGAPHSDQACRSLLAVLCLVQNVAAQVLHPACPWQRELAGSQCAPAALPTSAALHAGSD